MLKRQVWMTDHMLKNSQRVLKLSNQYKNYLCLEESTKKCNVMLLYRTYVLEGQADAKFSLDDIWNLFQKDALTSNNVYRLFINCMKSWSYLQKTLDLLLNRDHQASTQDHDGR